MFFILARRSLGPKSMSNLANITQLNSTFLCCTACLLRYPGLLDSLVRHISLLSYFSPVFSLPLSFLDLLSLGTLCLICKNFCGTCTGLGHTPLHCVNFTSYRSAMCSLKTYFGMFMQTPTTYCISFPIKPSNKVSYMFLKALLDI